MPKQSKKVQEKEKFFLPPSPLILAELAVLLDIRQKLYYPNVRAATRASVRRFDPQLSMIRAARFYGFAAYFYGELSKLSESSLLFLLAAPPSQRQTLDTLRSKYGRVNSPDKAHNLYLENTQTEDVICKRDTADGSDPARNYLSKHAEIFDWKKTRTVQTMILRFCKYHARIYNQQAAEPIAKFEQDAAQLARELDISIEELYKEYFADNRPQRLTGEVLHDEIMKEIEIRERDPSGRKRTGNERRLLGWSLSTAFLDDLIAWRRAMKKTPGGIEALDKLP